jgi:hypothetical protein
MNRPLMTVSLGALALLSLGCSQAGPVEASTVSAPDSPVQIDNRLAGRIQVPSRPETALGFRTTPDGLLQFYFELQNMTNESHTIRYTATFMDETGFAVDTQEGQIGFLKPQDVKQFQVICANTRGKKVRVLVLPAY